jgi:hypothetical protein
VWWLGGAQGDDDGHVVQLAVPVQAVLDVHVDLHAHIKRREGEG